MTNRVRRSSLALRSQMNRINYQHVMLIDSVHLGALQHMAPCPPQHFAEADLYTQQFFISHDDTAVPIAL